MPSRIPPLRRTALLLLTLASPLLGCGASDSNTQAIGSDEAGGSAGAAGSGPAGGSTSSPGGSGGFSGSSGQAGEAGAGLAGPGGAGLAGAAGEAGAGGLAGAAGGGGAGAGGTAGAGGEAGGAGESSGSSGQGGEAGASGAGAGGEAGGADQGGAGGGAGGVNVGGNGQLACGLIGDERACEASCGVGKQSCQPDGNWSECFLGSEGVEVCDGIDNDCDGLVDEDIVEDCSSVCGVGTRVCKAGGQGEWLGCSAKEPTPETCDNVDNDCDGKVDNGLIEACGDCSLGYSFCAAGQWTSCQVDYQPDEFQLEGTLRDFHGFTYGGLYPHPDFENANGGDKGIVRDLLGLDQLPVYKPEGDQVTPTTHGLTWFDMWYRDTPGYNLSKPHAIKLQRKAGVTPPTYTFDDPEFFPLDGQLFGNEGNPHNFHFTYELHSVFYYQGGEHFYFRGDDDLYVFVDGHLLINLGGVHGAEGQDIDIDAAVAQFGLKKCTPYQLDLFFAERHTSASSFRIETSLILLNK